MSVKTYNAADVDIIVAGIPITGYGDGTFVVVARDNPMFTKGSGADGEGWRAKSNDFTGTITITLLQMSAGNDALSALANLDEASGDGIGPFLMKDGSGRSLYAAESVWVEKHPDGEFARDKSEREWLIGSDRIQMFAGGN